MDVLKLIATVLSLVASAQSLPQPSGGTFSVERGNYYQQGKATFYSPHVMQDVAAYRGLQLDGTTGFATYPDCSEIGGVIWVSVLNPVTQKWSPWERKRIVDCSQTVDYARHKREGLVELSWEDAKKYGYRGEGRTQVRFTLER